jgi:hypothetical protein
MPKTYEKIATTTLGSAASSVTFSSISGAYTDLILVANYQCTNADQFLNLQFNSDSGSNYSNTNLFGDGSSATSNRTSNATAVRAAFYGSAQSNAIVQMMNYSNTTTNKTIISRDNTNTFVVSRANSWRSTSAINSIYIFPTGFNISSGSTFTLYGIKAA